MDTQEKVYIHPKPAAIERLARIEGESAFLSLLAGIEAGGDTTQDMAALAFTRKRAIPEVLECHVAQTDAFKRPLMSLTFAAMADVMRPSEKNVKAFKRWQKDVPTIQGAIADAFLLLRDGTCKPQKDRAMGFKVEEAVYSALRKVAAAVLFQLCNEAEQAWIFARFAQGNYSAPKKNKDLRNPARNSPGNRHDTFGIEERNRCEDFRRADGNYTARPFTSADSEMMQPLDTRGICIGRTSGLGWCDTHSAPAPVSVQYMPGYEPSV